MDYNSASVRNICKIFASIGRFFGVGPSNTANKIFPQPTFVAMAAKFETKGLYFGFCKEASRTLRLIGVFGGRAVE